MFQLLKNLYDKTEEIQGRRLLNLIASLFVVFLIVGFSIGYFINTALNNNEISEPNSSTTTQAPEFYEGYITYIDPQFYPGQNISYVLRDSTGQDIILLRASDQKLVVSEGLYAKVYGSTLNMDNDEKVLIVDRIVVQNATN